eukprot:3154024-Amphidinium_carterae.1
METLHPHPHKLVVAVSAPILGGSAACTNKCLALQAGWSLTLSASHCVDSQHNEWDGPGSGVLLFRKGRAERAVFETSVAAEARVQGCRI